MSDLQPDSPIADHAPLASDSYITAGRSVASLTTLATITVVCAILYIAKDLFLPLALGMLVAFILSPVVNALRRRGLRDMPAVILTVLATAMLVAAFVLVLAYQLSQIGANLPQYQGNVLGKVDTILDAGKDSRIIGHLQGLVENISDRLAAETATPEDQAMKVEIVEHTGVQDWLTQSRRAQSIAAAAAPAARAEPTAKAAAPAPARETPKKKLSYKEQRELEALPTLIESLEKEQKAVQEELADASLYTRDAERAALLSARSTLIEDELLQALERWEALGGV